MKFSALMIACLSLSVSSIARADDAFGQMPTTSDPGAVNVDPSTMTCPAEEKLQKCYLDLATNQTKCDEQIDAYADELTACLKGQGVEITDGEVKAEMGKDKDKRKWRQKGDKPKKPAAKPQTPKPTPAPKPKKPGEVRRHVPAGPTEDCAAGGTRHEYGSDKNGNGKLDDDEVDSSQTWMTCNGLKGEPGANGTNGTDGTNGIDGTNGTDGTNGRDGDDRVKMGFGLLTTVVVGAGEEPAYLTAPMLQLRISGDNVEWSAEAGLAPTGDNGTVLHTSLSWYLGDGQGFGLTAGLLGQWIGYDDRNLVKSQSLGFTPGLAYRHGGFRAEATVFVGTHGSYGNPETGAYGTAFSLGYGW